MDIEKTQIKGKIYVFKGQLHQLNVTYGATLSPIKFKLSPVKFKLSE